MPKCSAILVGGLIAATFAPARCGGRPHDRGISSTPDLASAARLDSGGFSRHRLQDAAAEFFTAADAQLLLAAQGTEVVIPPGFFSVISQFAFQQPVGACNSGVVSVVIPSSVVEVGAAAFAYCSLLAEVILVDSGLQTIGDSAFRGTGLVSIVVPDSVAEIGANAFSDCDSLTAVVLGSGLMTIGDKAFSGCSGLATIFSLPSGVANVGNDVLLGTGSTTMCGGSIAALGPGPLVSAGCSAGCSAWLATCPPCEAGQIDKFGSPACGLPDSEPVCTQHNIWDTVLLDSDGDGVADTTAAELYTPCNTLVTGGGLTLEYSCDWGLGLHGVHAGQCALTCNQNTFDLNHMAYPLDHIALGSTCITRNLYDDR